MAMDNENAVSGRGDMNIAGPDFDIPVAAAKVCHQLVMITGNINDPGTFPRLAQNLLNDVVVLLRPVNAAAKRPDINQIAHHVEGIEIVIAQKIQQHTRIGATTTEMCIRDPASTITGRL